MVRSCAIRSKAMLRIALLPLLALLVLAAPAGSAAKPRPTKTAKADPFDQRQLAGLQWRNIGPYRGGRVTAARVSSASATSSTSARPAAASGRPPTAASLGERSRTGFCATGSVGAIAVAPSDPNVIYAGMGEAASAATCPTATASTSRSMRANVDAPRASRLAPDRRVRIHPRDPTSSTSRRSATPSAPNQERGVFRSRDGGTTWDTCCSSTTHRRRSTSCMDPRNPRVALRVDLAGAPHAVESDQRRPGQRLVQVDRRRRHVDRDLQQRPARRHSGRSASPSRARNPIACGRSSRPKTAASIRSDDAGGTWERVERRRELRQRAWYYTTSSPTRRMPRRRLRAQRRSLAVERRRPDVPRRRACRTATTTICGSIRRIRRA